MLNFIYLWRKDSLLLAISQKRRELIEEWGPSCGGTSISGLGGCLNFQLCWRTNAAVRQSAQDSEEDLVLVTRDGRVLYPDVSDNNNSSGKSSAEGLLIRWAARGEEEKFCHSSEESVPVVNISLLSPEDGKGDIAR
jgi:hypothetical protein